MTNTVQEAIRGPFAQDGFDEMPHLQMLKLTEEFGDVVQHQELTLPNVVQDLPDGTRPVIPHEHCHTLLTIIAHATTLAMVSATLHEKLFLVHIAEPQIEIQDAQFFGDISTLVSYHGQVVVTLHDFLLSDACKRVEETYTLTCPLISYSAWTDSMGIFGGKTLNVLLQHLSRKVLKQVTDLTQACPDVNACCDDDASGAFEEDIAISMCANKYTAVESLYARLRTLLTNCQTVSDKLQVVPTIAKHAITKEAIRRAYSALASARDCLIFIDGVELLKQYGHHADGPSKAAAFITKNRFECKLVPEAFWRHMALLAKSAGTPVKTATGVTSVAAKLEVMDIIKKKARGTSCKLEKQPETLNAMEAQRTVFHGSSRFRLLFRLALFSVLVVALPLH